MSLTHYMPKKPLKAGYSVRAWVTLEDLERYKKLAEATGMPQSEIMTRILHAGIEALSEERLVLPLQFSVLHEKPASYRLAAIPLNDEKTNPDTPKPAASRMRKHEATGSND